MKERYWKYSLIVFILGLGYLLFRQAQPVYERYSGRIYALFAVA